MGNQAVYSFMDEWGWNMGLPEGSRLPATFSVDEVDKLIAERITGELQFLDGQSWQGIWALSKKHRKTLAAETTVMSVVNKTHAFMCKAGVETIAEANKEPDAKRAKTA